ncbi:MULTISPECIES: hypothetical protein [Enterococcus]|nr:MULTISPECIES: hypothetical protein [Enterococcus]MDF4226398.1 hypothetical protein [Enterococcus faecalis]MDK7811055.1 hypothetical protein [Enterococcus faecalis]MDU0912955.1 hypothetical protein [Enterococcus faecalis]MDU0936557.1 hypothetical protein [Enterococcus faecalis]MDU6173361.1 hypothetical protein [Enterococcus faecalis]
MINYTAIEKQQIMLKSDLLNNPLTLSERQLLQTLNLNQVIKVDDIDSILMDDSIKEKVANLLNQGMKLGVELEKLAQRGIDIVFPSNLKITDQLLNRFVVFPDILLTVGKKEFLLDENIKIVTSYADFKRETGNLILLADRNLDTLLRYSDISKHLMDGTLLLVTDTYRKKANIKSMDKEQIFDNKKVFISGSRSQKEISENVQKSLELIQKQNIKVLIGDSEKGVDNEIIDYLRVTPKYEAVEIYTIKQKPRVKIENEWETKFVPTNPSLKPQEKQMVKDRYMADAADWGLVVFNPLTKNRYGALQVSSGTLRNSIQMLLDKKAVKFFYVINDGVKVENLKTISGLKLLIEKYKEERLDSNEREVILSSKGVDPNSDPSFVKYQKINKKFEELLMNEQKIKKERIETKENNNEQTSLFG